MTDCNHEKVFPQIETSKVGDVSVTEVAQSGMEIRDLFAIEILSALIRLPIQERIELQETQCTDIHHIAYMSADLLLKAREETR